MSTSIVYLIKYNSSDAHNGPYIMGHWSNKRTWPATVGIAFFISGGVTGGLQFCGVLLYQRITHFVREVSPWYCLDSAALLTLHPALATPLLAWLNPNLSNWRSIVQ